MRERAVESSAGSGVGTDLMDGHRERTRGHNRILTKVAVTGSAAAGDAELEVSSGNFYAGRLQNIRTGTVLADEVDWQTMNVPVPAGEPILAKVSDAGATNVLVFHFETVRAQR